MVLVFRPLLHWIDMTATLATLLLAAALSVMAYVPTSEYREERIEGFFVLFSPDATKNPVELHKLREQLRDQLRFVNAALPPESLPALRRTRSLVEWRVNSEAAAEFHSSRVWLSANRYNPDKYAGIEINNLKNFIAWSEELGAPIILHELAHAYLHSLSDYEQLLIHLAYLDAKESGIYDSVEYRDGESRRAYAMTDTQEYFAELTEAYFSRNDYYPFGRTEVKEHDPQGFDALVHAWGLRAASAAP